MAEVTWSSLPDHVIANILSYLTPRDRLKAGTTCRAWHTCSKAPGVWRRMTFTFLHADDIRMLECVEQYGRFLRSVLIVLDQSHKTNRDNACSVLNNLSNIGGKRLNSLTIKFIGENPLFYAGQQLVEALKNVFAHPLESIEDGCSLKQVDISGLCVGYDQTMIDVLSENNPEIESLNIINETQICKVHPDCIDRLVARCRNLTDLRLFHCSLSDTALKTFAQTGRTHLRHLHILCRKEEALSKDLTSEAWAELVKRCPNLKVTLTFDHTCPLDKVSVIMKPEIPVVELRLETHTDIYNEVNQAASLYGACLETVVLQTSRSPGLSSALITLCRCCPRLTSLLVYCVLDNEVVEEILNLLPVMKERRTYILKWTLDPEPWLLKVEEDKI